jgi:hypothetical protein
VPQEPERPDEATRLCGDEAACLHEAARAVYEAGDHKLAYELELEATAVRRAANEAERQAQDYERLATVYAGRFPEAADQARIRADAARHPDHASKQQRVAAERERLETMLAGRGHVIATDQHVPESLVAVARVMAERPRERRDRAGRSSARSGDSGDDGADSEPPPPAPDWGWAA